MGKSTLTPEEYVHAATRELLEGCPKPQDIYERGEKVSFTRHVEILMSRFVGGDESTMGELYPLLTPYILKTIIKTAPDAAKGDAAKDILQSVFITICEKASGIRDLSTSQAWVGMIARNKTLDLMRKQQRKLETSVPVNEDKGDEGNCYENVPDTQITTSRDVEESMIVAGILSKLSDEDRKIFQRLGMDRMPQKTVAQELGMNLNTLKVRYGRIKARLQKDADCRNLL